MEGGLAAQLAAAFDGLTSSPPETRNGTTNTMVSTTNATPRRAPIRGEVSAALAPSAVDSTTPRTTQIVRRPTVLPPKAPSFEVSNIGQMFESTFENIKELLGFVPECFHGGTRLPNQQCRCPPLFLGRQCEQIQCLNNGTRVAITKMTPTSYICKCPFPEFISGSHCEKVQCANGGRLIEKTASCECTDVWHKGRFCEDLAVQSWQMLLCPVLVVLLIVFCCIICKMDWCPRRSSSSRHRGGSSAASRSRDRSRRRPVPSNRAPTGSREPNGSGSLVQEHLLGEERGACMRGPAYPTGVVPPFVIRLDTIPTFNPAMLGGVQVGEEEFKQMEPPPSYEQAITSVPRPPEYTPREGSTVASPVGTVEMGVPAEEAPPPPPPNRRPPRPPG